MGICCPLGPVQPGTVNRIVSGEDELHSEFFKVYAGILL